MPNYVAGSGLSNTIYLRFMRLYNILNKISDSFGRDRMYLILPKDGEGTLTS